MPKWIGRCWYWIMIQVGKLEYVRIIRQYPGCMFLYTPTASIGDLCYVRRNLTQILRINKIEDPFIILVEESIADVAQFLGFKTILSVSKVKFFPIVMMHTLYGSQTDRLFNCYPWEMVYQSHIIKSLEMESLLNCEKGQFKDINIFPDSKNIILAPHENTVSLMKEQTLPDIFWEKMADALKEKGYSVYTNCRQNSEEKAIRGTKVINVPSSKMLGAMPYVDGFIAIRSGLVDLLCDIPVRQIILYPTSEWLDKFGLSVLSENHLLEEIIYQEYMPEPFELVKRVAIRF
ncbi:MAG: hypothetical protein K2N34_03135 [Lachnospiraceae bacterium]|nr:hypothetical protein [Lachnospiraceae bacterium]